MSAYCQNKNLCDNIFEEKYFDKLICEKNTWICVVKINVRIGSISPSLSKRDVGAESIDKLFLTVYKFRHMQLLHDGSACRNIIVL